MRPWHPAHLRRCYDGRPHAVASAGRSAHDQRIVISTLNPPKRRVGRRQRYIELPVSSTDFMSLRIQAQPPVPISENLLATMPAMIGAPSSSWITVSLEKPAATFSISHVTRVKPSAFMASLNRNR